MDTLVCAAHNGIKLALLLTPKMIKEEDQAETIVTGSLRPPSFRSSLPLPLNSTQWLSLKEYDDEWVRSLPLSALRAIYFLCLLPPTQLPDLGSTNLMILPVSSMRKGKWRMDGAGILPGPRSTYDVHKIGVPRFIY